MVLPTSSLNSLKSNHGPATLAAAIVVHSCAKGVCFHQPNSFKLLILRDEVVHPNISQETHAVTRFKTL